jgi:hypothetical protein
MRSLRGIRPFFTARDWRGYPYLISPFFDFMLAGGFALVVFVLQFALFPPGGPEIEAQAVQVAVVMGWLAYLVNDPHFIVSYQLLYRGYTKKLARFRLHRELWLRYVAAGIVVPLLLAGYLASALLFHAELMFGAAVQFMLLLVGWHYVKQAFGVFMMLSSMKRIYYGPRQRRFLLLNSYIAWACYVTLVLAERPDGPQYLWGLTYTQQVWLNIPDAWVMAAGYAFLVSAVLSVFVIIWKRPAISYSACAGYGSLYLLLFMAAFHPFWILIYPFFHSLQYLLFVYAYKRGEHRQRKEGASPAERRRLRAGLIRWCAASVIGGAVFFTLLPMAGEWLVNPGSTLFPLTAACIIFINVHHYFIDNVIWRKEHPEIAAYLFGPVKKAS